MSMLSKFKEMVFGEYDEDFEDIEETKEKIHIKRPRNRRSRTYYIKTKR